MCVAVVIQGPSPTISELCDMEISNPHGAGLAWADPGRNGVAYTKGLDALEVHRLLQDMPRPALLHFRWATHGPKVPRLCHPFPLGPKAILSTSLEGIARDGVLIHNGVWSGFEKHVPKWLDKSEWSDTAVGAYVARDNPSILKDMSWATATGHLGPEGELIVHRTGGWAEHEGNMYSNLSWQKHKYSKAYTRYLARRDAEAKENETDWEAVDWSQIEWCPQAKAFRYKRIPATGAP